MVKISTNGVFDIMYSTLVGKNPSIKERVDTRVMLFKNNPDDTRLDNHALRKRMKGKWAFSITGDIRIVYVWKGKTTVRFLAIGTHEQVYGKIK